MIGNAIAHFVKCIIGLDKPHSQTTLAEQNTIAKYSGDVLLAVEIGVYEGVNTAVIGNSINSAGTLYAIDPFFKGKLGICYHERIARRHVKASRVSSSVKYIAKLSFDAVNDIPDNVDFIFVDGDHSEDGIRKDWALYAPKVKPGGIIALHDTSIPAHDATVSNLGSYKYFVSHIVNDPNFKLLETVDSLNIMQRK